MVYHDLITNFGDAYTKTLKCIRSHHGIQLDSASSQADESKRTESTNRLSDLQVSIAQKCDSDVSLTRFLEAVM